MEYNDVLTEDDFRDQFSYVAPQRTSLKERAKQSIHCSKQCACNVFLSFFPILTWFPKYKLKNYLPGDIIGGVTTAIVRIPQSLAYGLLAGLQPINGMYVAFFAPLVYTFLGTSRHVSVGTFAVISLMLGSALENYLSIHPAPVTNSSSSNSIAIATTASYSGTTASELGTTIAELTNSNTPVTEESYKLAVIGALTLLVGLIQIGLGFFRLGFVAIFLSDSLVSGFTTGAALFVFTAQVKYFFGIPLNRQSSPFALIKTYIELFSRIQETKWSEVIISVVCLAVLYPVKLINVKYKKKLHNIPIPIELIVVVIGTIISWAADFKGRFNVDVVNAIPSGLPAPQVPDISTWSSLIGDAFPIAIVSFAITVSIGKLFAKRHNYKISPNQELFALGVSQIACGMFQGHACSGALARSSVKESSGTKTQFSDVVSCIVILFVLLLIGQYLAPLPVACLSSIILINIRGLLKQVTILPRLWALSKPDFVVWVITFTAVALLGVALGLAIGVLGLLITVVLSVYNPQTTVRGGLGDTDIYRDIEKFKKAKEVPGIKIIRFPQSPFFGNVAALQEVSSEAMFVSKSCDQPLGGTGERSHLLDERIELKEISQRDDETISVINDVKEANDAPNVTNTLHPNNNLTASANTSDVGNNDDDHVAESRDAESGHVNGKGGKRRSPNRVSLDPNHCFHTIIFDCSGWTFIDLMGMEAVRQICTDFGKLNLQVFLASVQPGIMSKLVKVGVVTSRDSDEESLATVFSSVRFAVEAAKRSDRHKPFVTSA
uniref:Sulfate transporter-like n=1 Tax=Phallusia mammillata TaxID=59560 RepID=A0A6F9DSP1_9ASCI|nr:sulfate transporter-like [Phallusia mammillata]